MRVFWRGEPAVLTAPVPEVVKVKVVEDRRVGLAGHSVFRFTLGLRVNFFDAKAFPLSTSMPEKKSSASDDFPARDSCLASAKAAFS
jgi:hypothetical protein